MLKSGELVICGDTCPELVQAIPTRLHNPEKASDIIKTQGDYADEFVDAFRYAIYSFVTASDVHQHAPVRFKEEMKDSRSPGGISPSFEVGLGRIPRGTRRVVDVKKRQPALGTAESTSTMKGASAPALLIQPSTFRQLFP
jgi:hypothetical protein